MCLKINQTMIKLNINSLHIIKRLMMNDYWPKIGVQRMPMLQHTIKQRSNNSGRSENEMKFCHLQILDFCC